jgi:hypothetical protein
MHSGRRFAKQTAERSEQSFRTPKKKCKIFFETCLRGGERNERPRAIFSYNELFGRELRLLGGIDKRAMIAGPEAIDAELARVVPLLKEGGYIPWCDHHVPPDVSLENYLYYVRRMKEASLDPDR